jgi:hypothetical protein
MYSYYSDRFVYFDDVKRFCRKEADAHVSFTFPQRTEKSARVLVLSQNATEHAVLLYPRVCRGCFELTNKTDMMKINLLELLKTAIWWNFIKHFANVQNTCGFRTHSQLILVLERAARLVGKRFRWLTGHVFWRHEASAQRRTYQREVFLSYSSVAVQALDLLSFFIHISMYFIFFLIVNT